MRLPFISTCVDLGKAYMQRRTERKQEEISQLVQASMERFNIVEGKEKRRPSDYNALVKRFKSWVYVAANRNANSIAQLPLRLFVTTNKGQKKPRFFGTKAVTDKHLKHLNTNPIFKNKLSRAENVEEITDHPLLTLLDNPNPHMDGFTLKKLMVDYLELTGDNFIQKIRDGMGTVTQLWRLPSQWTWVVPSRENFIKGYLFGRNSNKRIAIEAQDVIHTIYPHPDNIHYGLSPVEAGILAVDSNTSMKEYNIRLMDNSGRPDMAVIRKEGLNDGQLKKLRSEWRRLYGSVRNAGKPAFLGGDITIQNLGFSPREMQYLSGLKNAKEEIAGLFDMPVAMLTTSDVNLANAMAGLMQYARFGVLPRSRLVENSLNNGLTNEFDERLFLAFDNPVPEDNAAKLLERESNLNTGYSSINIERAKDNQEPVPWGNVPLPSVIGFAAPGIIGNDPVKQAKHNCQDHHIKLLVEPLDQNEKKLKNAVQGVMDDQEKEVLKVGSADIDWDKSNVALAAASLPILTVPFKSSGDSALRGIGFAGAVDTPDSVSIALADWVDRPESVQFMKDNTLKFATQVNATTERQLRASLAEGIQAGESVQDLKKRIPDVFIKRKNSAEMIARTESQRSANSGQVEAWKRSEVVVAKQWSANADACVFCSAMDGKIIPLNSTFVPVGGSVVAERNGQPVTLDVTYIDVESADLHPNDRCTLLPIFGEVALSMAIRERKNIDDKILKASLLYHAKNKGRN